MKILQINSVCGIGSTGRIATDIHNILIQQGHESFIAYGRDQPKNCDTTIRIGSKFDIYNHVVLTRVFDMHGFGSKQATKEFVKKVEVLDPDIIHLHNIHGYYINIEVLFDYLKIANKPVVWTLHDCWAFTGHCTYFDYADCPKWINKCYDCPEVRTYPSSIMFDRCSENYVKKQKIFNGVSNLTIVTPSKWLADLVKKSFLKDYPVKVINNGIDLNIFKPTKSDFRKDNNINNYMILGVANVWDRRKGLKYFYELANQLSNGETIVLVGLTEKQIKKLPNRIIGIKKTSNIEELVEIYSAADVFINTTLEDNFPTTNLESLGCGTPVITFKTGGSVESIDNSSGVVVERGDVKAIIDNFKSIETNITQEKCLLRARMFSKKISFNKYVTLYNNLAFNK